MHGTINAIGLIACVALTAAALIFADRQRASLKQILIGVLIALSTMIGAGVVSAHLCRAGQPFTQWLIPCICIIAIVSKVHRLGLRISATAILVIAAFVLSFHFSELVHWSGYTGNPHEAEHLQQARLRGLAESLRANESLDELPAGWLREVAPALDAESVAWLEDLDSQPEMRRYWHTWLTWIYRPHSLPADVWYPGGPIAENASRVELRRKTPEI